MKQQANIIGVIENKTTLADDGRIVLDFQYVNPDYDSLEFLDPLKIICPPSYADLTFLNPGQPLAMAVTFIYSEANGRFVGEPIPGTIKAVSYSDLIQTAVLDTVIMKDLPVNFTLSESVFNAILYRLSARFAN